MARMSRGVAPAYGDPLWPSTLQMDQKQHKTPPMCWPALYRWYVLRSWWAAWRLADVRKELEQFECGRIPLTAFALTLKGQEQRLRTEWLMYENRAALAHKCRRTL